MTSLSFQSSTLSKTDADTLHALQALKAQIQAAAAAGHSVKIQGSGSKAFYAEHDAVDAPPKVRTVLDTRQHSGIVSYEPTELVITAKCGTPLAEIEALLAENGQSLAFEPPNHNGKATFGGMLAAGLSGPARASAGSVRDYVLGAQVIDGRGQILDFGGVVMKNVAGYDVSRLLTGSLGSLGVITQASVKVWPVAKITAYVQFNLALSAAVQCMNEWAGKPLPISATCWHGGVLTLRLAGAKAAVDAALIGFAKQAGTAIESSAGAALFAALRHQSLAFFMPQAGRVLMRLSLPSAVAPLGVDGEALIEWGGAQRWIHTTDPVGTRAKTVAAGGHATLWLRGASDSDLAKTAPVFTPLDAVTAAITQRLRAEYDPHGVFQI